MTLKEEAKEYANNKSSADGPLRQAVRNKYFEMFGVDEVCASGWGIDQERYEILRILHSKSTVDLKKNVE